MRTIGQALREKHFTCCCPLLFGYVSTKTNLSIYWQQPRHNWEIVATIKLGVQTGQRAQQSRALVTCLEDLGLSPITHIAITALNNSSPGGIQSFLSASTILCAAPTDKQKKILLNINIILKIEVQGYECSSVGLKCLLFKNRDLSLNPLLHTPTRKQKEQPLPCAPARMLCSTTGSKAGGGSIDNEL